MAPNATQATKTQPFEAVFKCQALFQKKIGANSIALDGFGAERKAESADFTKIEMVKWGSAWATRPRHHCPIKLEEAMKHHHYVTTVEDTRDWLLHFGLGKPQAEADEDSQASCGKRKMKKARRWVASSDLPFAPQDRDATEDEADVWVCSGHYIRAVRAELNEVTV